MGWSIPEVPEISLQNKKFKLLEFKSLIIIFLVVYLLTIGLTLLFWPSDKAFDKLSLIFLIVIFPLLIFTLVYFILLSLRVNKEHKITAWEAEKQKIQQRWQKWSRMHWEVLSNAVLFPEEINADQMLNSPNQLPIRLGENILFLRDNKESEQLLESFIVNTIEAIKEIVHSFPPDIELTVHIGVAEDDVLFSEIIDKFKLKISLYPEFALVKLDFLSIKSNISLLDDMLENDKFSDKLNLILMTVLNQDQEDANSSEGLSYLLIAKPAIARQSSLNAGNRVKLLRPNTIESDSQVKHSLEQLLSLQIPPESIAGFWTEQLDKKINTKLRSEFNDKNISLLEDFDEQKIYDMTKRLGNPNAYTPWIVLSLVIAFAKKTNSTQLYACTSTEISTIGAVAMQVP